MVRIQQIFSRLQLEDFNAGEERPPVGRGAAEQFILSFRQGDIEIAFARIRAFQEKAEGQRGLTCARAALN